MALLFALVIILNVIKTDFDLFQSVPGAKSAVRGSGTDGRTTSKACQQAQPRVGYFCHFVVISIVVILHIYDCYVSHYSVGIIG